jgi:hypothetical protein
MEYSLSNSLKSRKKSSTGTSLLNGLISHWKLNEVSGTRADSHGNSTLIQYGTIAGVAGKIGNAAEFDSGESLYNTDTPFSGNINPSVSFWANRSSILNVSYPFICDSSFGFTFSGGNLNLDGVWLDQLNVPVVASVSAITNVSDGNWHFITGVANTTELGKSVSIYVDGILDNIGYADVTDYGSGRIAEMPPSQIRLNGNTALDFGQGAEKLDSVSIWQRPLTNVEILRLYNNGSGLDYQNF